MSAPNRFAPKPTTRPFAWSYSALKNFESCGLKYYHLSIAKDIKEPQGEALLAGQAIHNAIAEYVTNKTPLPAEYEKYKELIDKQLSGVGHETVTVAAEHKMALTDEFEPCEFFGNRAWLRGAIDFSKIKTTEDGKVCLLVDWKYGDRVVEDSMQLAIFAALYFAKYPDIGFIRTRFVYLKQGLEFDEDWSREDIVDLWNAILPRVNVMKEAYEKMEYHPTKSGLCKAHCPVLSCEHNGKRVQ